MQQAVSPSEGGSPRPATAPADRAPPPDHGAKRTPPRPATAPAAPGGVPGSTAPGAAAPGGPAIQVEDDLQPRVRMPADLLRCILTGLELLVVAGISLLGVQVNASGATHRLPTGLVAILGLPGRHFRVRPAAGAWPC